MVVPTTEIPQRHQQTARDMLPGPFGRISPQLTDRLMRVVHAARSSADAIQGYRLLLDTSDAGAPAFFDLDATRQERVLDVMALQPTSEHGALLAGVLRALFDLSSPADTLIGEVVNFAVRPIHFRNYSGDDVQQHARAHYLAEQPARLRGITTILRHASFVAQPSIRMGVVDVMHRMVPSACSMMRELLDPADGQPTWRRVASGALPIQSVALRGSETLLDHLVRLANGSLDSRVRWAPLTRILRGTQVRVAIREADEHFPFIRAEVERARVLGDLVCEVARPDQFMNQSNRGTCTVTTVLHRLAVMCPAEYARIAADLAMTGQSTLLGGDVIQVPRDAFEPDDGYRSVSERLTQSAMLRFSGNAARDAQGHIPEYRNVSPEPRRDDPRWEGTSAIDAFVGTVATPNVRAGQDLVRTLQSLLGGTFVSRAVEDSAPLSGRVALARALQAELPRQNGTPIFVGIAIDTTDRPARGQQPAQRNVPTGKHLIDVYRIEQTDGPAEMLQPPRVIFWNPWGAPQLMTIGGFPIAIGGVAETGDVVEESDARAYPYVEGTMQRSTLDGPRGMQWTPLSELERCILMIVHARV